MRTEHKRTTDLNILHFEQSVNLRRLMWTPRHNHHLLVQTTILITYSTRCTLSRLAAASIHHNSLPIFSLLDSARLEASYWDLRARLCDAQYHDLVLVSVVCVQVRQHGVCRTYKKRRHDIRCDGCIGLRTHVAEAVLGTLAHPPPEDADVSTVINYMDAQKKVLTAVPKICEERDPPLRRVLDIYATVMSFGGPSPPNKIVEARGSTLRELGEVVSGIIKHNNDVRSEVSLEACLCLFVFLHVIGRVLRPST